MASNRSSVRKSTSSFDLFKKKDLVKDSPVNTTAKRTPRPKSFEFGDIIPEIKKRIDSPEDKRIIIADIRSTIASISSAESEISTSTPTDIASLQNRFDLEIVKHSFEQLYEQLANQLADEVTVGLAANDQQLTILEKETEILLASVKGKLRNEIDSKTLEMIESSIQSLEILQQDVIPRLIKTSDKILSEQQKIIIKKYMTHANTMGHLLKDFGIYRAPAAAAATPGNDRPKSVNFDIRA